MRQYPKIVTAMIGLCIVQFGCQFPAQLAWSPDGSKAGYRVGDDAYVIAKDGGILAKLGKSSGALAWSRDGKRLYYAASLPDDLKPLPEPTPVDRTFFRGPTPPASVEEVPTIQPIRVFENGASREVCRLRGGAVHAVLSPDESWLAVMVMMYASVAQGEDTSKEQWLDLYAISLRDGVVRLLTHPASFGIAFTGNDRLAYVDRDFDGWASSPVSTKLAEVSLNEPAAPRATPFKLTEVPIWLRAHGEDLWLTTAKVDDVRAGNGGEAPLTLRRFARQTAKVVTVAENVNHPLTISPDGKRLLVGRAVGPNGDETFQLVVMNADGSNAQVVRTTTRDNFKEPLFPSWRDDGHLMLPSEHPIREDGDEQNRRQLFAVEEYEVGDDNAAKRVRTISGKWRNDLLPYTRTSDLGRKIPKVKVSETP